jgi:DNA-binding IclR family transcriptional regulator
MSPVLSITTESKNLGPRLPAVDRALSLFELLANSQTGLTLSEVSRKLHIPKSTAHYLIHTLATRGYIQHSCDGRHISLGLRLSDLADSNRARSQLASVIAPFLREASQRLNLAAIGTVLLGAEGVIIGKYGCPNDPGGDAWAGRHIDLHCTAQGKALIAYLPESRLNELFRGREPAQFTSKTISNFAALRAHLALVREQGFAVNNEEQVLGIRAVAAPVVDRNGSVVLAITVRGSTREIPGYRIEQLGFEMIRIASEVSRELGGAQWERPFASRRQG